MENIEQKVLIHPLQAIMISSDEIMRKHILSGEEKITIREGWRNYKPGFSLIACPFKLYCAGVDITSVRHCLLNEVTEEEYIANNYKSTEDMLNDLKRYYPNLNEKSPVTIIRWDNVRGQLVDELLTE